METRVKTKEERIRGEKNRLRKYFKKLTKEEQALALPLIERAAFMRVECEDLEEDLHSNGWTELFTQSKGVEPYDRARPAGQTYLTLNKNYQNIIKQLEALLPKTEIKADDDGFEDFVSGRDEE